MMNEYSDRKSNLCGTGDMAVKVVAFICTRKMFVILDGLKVTICSVIMIV